MQAVMSCPTTSPRIPRSSPLRCTAGIILDEKATVALQGTAPEAQSRTGVLTLTTLILCFGNRLKILKSLPFPHYANFMEQLWNHSGAFFLSIDENMFLYVFMHIFLLFCFGIGTPVPILRRSSLTVPPQIAAQVIAELQTKDPREVPNPSGPQCVHNLIFVMICILYIYIYTHIHIYIYDIFIYIYIWYICI